MERETELVIAELSPTGEGVGIIETGGERRAVFVSDVLVGERVVAAVDLSRRPARGKLLRVVEPSGARVESPCAHVAKCGGCDWMHLATNAQTDAHAAIVRSILPPAFRSTAVVAHPAGPNLGYRTRARVHLEAGRSGKIAVGMFARNSHDAVAVDRCVVLHQAIEKGRLSIERWISGSRGRGEAHFSLGALPSSADGDRKVVLDLRWSSDFEGAVFGRIERAVQEGELAGARIFSGAVRKPAVIGDPTPWIAGADGVPLRLGPGGFSQANETCNVTLAKRVAELATQAAPEAAKVVELYAGAGNLSVLLAARFDLTTVESDSEACAAARKNLADRSLRARITEADAATFEIPKATKLVVLDPPRTGAREVMRALAARSVHSALGVLYVSCDPPTLGRDLTTLAEAGYRLEHVETFEMFPQTSHVETVALLVRKPAS